MSADVATARLIARWQATRASDHPSVLVGDMLADRLVAAEAQRDTLAEVVAAAQRYESLSAGFRAGDGTDWSDVDRAKRDYRAALAAVAPTEAKP